MTVRVVGLEARGIARPEHGLAAVVDQHDFAFEDEDELIFLLVPMPQRGRGAGLQRRQVDPELVEAGRVAEPLARAAGDDSPERLGIVRASIDRDFGDVDLGHNSVFVIAERPRGAPAVKDAAQSVPLVEARRFAPSLELRIAIHTRSMIVAVPMPAPMHSVTSAVARLRRSSSSSTVPRIIAPVAPSGCPMAMAPPLTFIFAGSRSNACR